MPRFPRLRTFFDHSIVRAAVIALVVGAGGFLAVGGVQLFLDQEAGVAADLTADCDPADGPHANVTVIATVQRDRMDFPRVLATTDIHVPKSWAPRVTLLSDREFGPYRSAIRCLFDLPDDGQPGPNLVQVRRNPPAVTAAANGDLIVHDEVWTELTKPGRAVLGAIRLESQDDGTWGLSVVAPSGLAAADSWTITVKAPADWLVAPDPGISSWPDTLAADSVTWKFTRGASKENLAPNLTSMVLRPDGRTQMVTFTGTTPGRILSGIFSALESAAFIGLALGLIVFLRKRKPDLAAPGWRLTLPMFGAVLASFAIGLTGTILDSLGDRVTNWSPAAWAADIAVWVLILSLAWCWWLPRGLVLILGLLAAAVLTAIPFLSDQFYFQSQNSALERAMQLAEVGLAFAVTFLTCAALANVIRVLSTRPDRPRRVPLLIWLGAGVVAAGLVLERYGTSTLNTAQSGWRNNPTSAVADLAQTFRYYLWGFPDAWFWSFEVVAAVLALVVVLRFLDVVALPDRRTCLVMAAVLFVLGPAYLTLFYAGWSFPLWLLAIAILIGALFIDKPVFRRELAFGATVESYVGMRRLAGVRADAVEWISHQTTEPPRAATGPNPVVDAPGRNTPLDVLLAVGAGRRPYDNVVRMCRLMVWPAVAGGLTMQVVGWSAGVDYSGGYPDSFVTGYLSGLVWEFVKWLFAAAVAGVLWQYLPGKRGPIKVLPVIAAYLAGPLLSFGVPFLFGGGYSAQTWLDAGLFAAVMITVGVRMDISVLRDLKASRRISRKQFVTTYGLGNLPSRITVALAPVTAAIAIFGALFTAHPEQATVDRTPTPPANTAPSAAESPPP